jgi:glycosyltransferase involved in cell wall biosynthesis
VTSQIRSAAPVSVVIPCYRCAATIGRALASVLAQTWPVAEIILVDDASGDETWAVLEAWRDLQTQGSGPVVQVIAAGVNQGAGEARNLGWAAARQPWIAFLDADDAWHPRKIEVQYGWLELHPKVVLCAHRSVVAATADWPLPQGDVMAAPAQRIHPARLPFSNQLPTRSVMVRRDLSFRFHLGKRLSEDFTLWLMIVGTGLPAWRIEWPLACSFRPEFSGGGLSSRLWATEQGELEALAIVRRAGLLGPVIYGLAVLWSLFKFGRRLILRRGLDLLRQRIGARGRKERG